jgi:putative spermidine/putrescine transport system substrate-binding protein
MRKQFVLGLVVAISAAIVPAVSMEASSAAAKKPAPVNYATCASLAACGGMDALVKAAQKEGTINLVTLPRGWANYGEAMDLFHKAFGIKIVDDNPDGSSAYEINAIETAPQSKKPDWVDVGITYAQNNENLFAAYKVVNFKDIPTKFSNPDGRWTSDYAGEIALIYPLGLPKTPTSLAGLTDPAFKGMVAIGGDPTSAQESLMSVFAANMASGGAPDDVSKGIAWFSNMKKIGNFVTVPATPANFASGAYKIGLTWNYNCPDAIATSAKAGVKIQCAIPSDAQLVGTPYIAAIPANAPHPAAARLWNEFMYSQNNKGFLTATLPSTAGKTGSAIFNSLMGGQNIWVSGGAVPTMAVALAAKGMLNDPPASVLPAKGTPVTPTVSQQNAAKALLATEWPKVLSN